MRARHSPVSERDSRDLLDLLYDAATSQDGWHPFLAALTALTRSEMAALMAYDTREKAGDVLSIYGAENLVPAEYAAWAEKNLLVTSVADQMRTGTIMRNAPVSRR